MTKPTGLPLFGLLTAGVLLTGCIETREDFTLNPDGSGKVVYESTTRTLSFGGDESPEDTLRDTLRKLTENSTGIDAWKDLQGEVLPDGRVHVKGIAYFSSFDEANLESSGLSREENNPQLTREDDTLTLTIQSGKEAGTGSSPPALTDDQVEARLTQVKSQLAQAKGMMQAMLSGFRVQQTFRLPGTVQASQNLIAEADGAFGYTLEGEAMMAALNQIWSDESFLREQIRAGTDVSQSNDAQTMERLNEQLFGTRGPLSLTVTGATAPLFDYPAEMTAARDQMPAMMEALGVVMPVPVEPAGEGGFQSVHVGGVKLVTGADSDAGIHPFNEIENGFSLSLVGILPGSVLALDEGVVNSAIADTGEDLLPEREYDRTIHFPSLSEDRTKAVFDIQLQAPGPGVTGLREVSGSITYLVAQGSRDVDLGIAEFSAGTAGTELGAHIKSVGKASWGDGMELSLKLDVDNDTIKEIQVYDANGNQLDTERGGSMSSGSTTTIDIRTETTFPAQGRIVVVLHDQLQKFAAPFSVTGIDLLGRTK